MAINERVEHITLDEWIRLSADGPIEIIDGEVIHVSPSVIGPNVITRALFLVVYNFGIAHDLGEAFTEAPYVLSDKPNWVKGSLVPDVMYFQKDRLATYKANNSDWRNKPFILVPDLVAEVISPTDLYSQVERKVLQYLADGVKLIWLLNPEQQTVNVRQAGSKQQLTLTQEDTLDGGSIIPGFAVAVASLFKD